MTRKRYFFLALGLALTLSGCRKTPAPEVSSAPSPTPPASSAPLPTSTPTASPASPAPTPFRFTRENLPRLDGSTATVPLAEAVAAALLGESREEVGDLIQFNKTSRAYYNLVDGDAELLLVAEGGEDSYQYRDRQGKTWRMEPLAAETLVFFVNEDNPVEDLTLQQVREIYSGKLTNWKQVGGADAPIQAYQRPKGGGSQAIMDKEVMGDLPMMKPANVSYVAGEMGDIIAAVRAWDSQPDAIGYTVYYYAHDMGMTDGLKLLSIDGVSPSDETIRSGEYPIHTYYYAVMDADAPEDSPASILFDWLLSQEGQNLVSQEGYVSILAPAPATGPSTVYTDRGGLEPRQPQKPVYTRRYEAFTDRLVPAEDYGTLVPFPAQYVDGGYMGPLPLYGLVTLRGEIVVDPVFSNVYPVSSYDYDAHTFQTLDILTLTLDDPSRLRALCAPDGSWCTDFLYSYILYDPSFGASIPAIRGNTLALLDPETGQEFRTVDYAPYLAGANGCWVGDAYLDPETGWLSLNLSLYKGESGDGWQSEDYRSWELPLLFDPQGNLCPLPEGVTQLGRYGDGRILAWGPKGDSYTYMGYIDTAGGWAIPPTLFRAHPFEKGAALVFSDGGYHFIDTQGNSLTEPIPCDSVRRHDGCWYLLGYNHDVAAVYDEDHRPVDSPLVGLYRPVRFLGDGWVSAQDEENTYLVQGDRSLQFPLSLGELTDADENHLLFSCLLEDGRTALTVTGKNGQVISSIEVEGFVSRAYFVGAGTPCLKVTKGGTDHYYDLRGNELGLLSGFHENLTSYGGVIATTTEEAFSLTGPDGKVLFYWPIREAID